ncbi:MAG: hypothetical protein WHS65_01750 [Melioribacteraceae bacterium]
MEIRVFDLIEDKKVNAKCLLVDIRIGKYLELIEENLEDLDIQRGMQLSRRRDVYKRLIEDLKQGALIPPISLVLKKNSSVYDNIKNKNENDTKEIEEIMNAKINIGDFSILDGLQRTFCLLNVRDDLKDEKEKFLNRRLRAEIWYDITTTALLYKMLVLNTGQVKMSMRHQIEILNIPLKESFLEIAKNRGITIKFSTFREPTRNDELHTYKFSNIVEAFTAFITKDPIVDKTNVVVQELERMNFIEEHSSTEILRKDEEVNEFVDILINLDNALWNKYKNGITEEDGKRILPWTSRNNIMNSPAILSGIFAAFGKAFSETQDKNEYKKRKEKLLQILSTNENDSLKLESMSKILEDEKSRTQKFGETTRKFFFNAFREFFIRNEDNFERIWQRSVE